MTKAELHQEICDLFARNNGGSLQEGQIVSEGLEQLLSNWAQKFRNSERSFLMHVLDMLCNKNVDISHVRSSISARVVLLSTTKD